ncbi:tyrosine phosphatase [Trypanosoma rangeli]|uniref:diphosphoinositol-polyphosphate diphosphatase n=1 Tax=Trypanosoma rangeli TaxID=5698 RepID=A0A422N9L9_TRYRA|nr:tyrosine phosphatase [Trypanosoma rangeli]RNF02188.1 tyrosine phosphatase [Trypanosoma rangeli]|eukprot:RNF02188.1 tyrosine phosphatase [Trypanosoma rangeli]
MATALPSSSALMPRQLLPAMQEPLVPSINFAMVCPGVYRSGYPTRKNYRFLRALRLRTILYLCPEDYAESNVKFCEENGICLLRFATEGNKEPFMDISEMLMHRILSALVDTRTHPILIHCNKGKHRTGAVVACLRLLQGWSLVSIFQEYRCFAGDKARMGDQQYVELYHPIVRVTPPYVAEWLCITREVTVVQTEEELLEAEAQQLGWSLVAPPSPPAPTPPSPPSLPKKQNAQPNPQPHPEEHKDELHKLPPLPPSSATVPAKLQPSTVTVGSATSITATPTSRRSGGHGEGASESGKTKDTGVVLRKENGDSKKGQK